MPQISINPNPHRLEFTLPITASFDILNKVVITRQKCAPRIAALAQHRYAMVGTFKEVLSSKECMLHNYIFLTAILREEEMELSDEFVQLILSDSIRRTFHQVLEQGTSMNDILIKQAYNNELSFNEDTGYSKDYLLDIAQINIREAKWVLNQIHKAHLIEELSVEFEAALDLLISTSMKHSLSDDHCFIDYYLANVFVQPMDYDLEINNLYKDIQQYSD